MEAVARWELASGSAASEESVAVPARAAAEPQARLDAKRGQWPRVLCTEQPHARGVSVRVCIERPEM